MGRIEPTFREIWHPLRSGWRVIAVSTVALGSLFLLIGLLLPPTYSAETLLSPARDDAEGSALLASFAAGASPLGGLLGGWNVARRKEEAVATLSSRLLTESFVRDKGLLPVLFPDAWDSKNGGWKADLKKVPTLWDANRVFNGSIRKVFEDRKTGLVTLTINWSDPALAAQWANELVTRTNDLLRARALTRSGKNIVYIKHQLKETTLLETRQALYSLLEAEYKNAMLAQGSEEYAFTVLDPAVTPERAYSPRRALLVALGSALGLFLSSAFLVTRSLLSP